MKLKTWGWRRWHFKTSWLYVFVPTARSLNGCKFLFTLQKGLRLFPKKMWIKNSTFKISYILIIFKRIYYFFITLDLTISRTTSKRNINGEPTNLVYQKSLTSNESLILSDVSWKGSNTIIEIQLGGIIFWKYFLHLPWSWNFNLQRPHSIGVNW